MHKTVVCLQAERGKSVGGLESITVRKSEFTVGGTDGKHEMTGCSIAGTATG